MMKDDATEESIDGINLQNNGSADQQVKYCRKEVNTRKNQKNISSLSDPKWVRSNAGDFFSSKLQKGDCHQKPNASFVTQGHTQEEGIDYDEVFAPVARIEVVKAIMDSIKHQELDDIIFGSTKKELCEEFVKLMKDKFQMSSMGELTFFLGLQNKSNRRRGLMIGVFRLKKILMRVEYPQELFSAVDLLSLQFLGAFCTQRKVSMVSFGRISPNRFLSSILLVVVIIITVVIVVVILVVVIFAIVEVVIIVVFEVSRLLMFPSMLRGVPSQIVGLLALAYWQQFDASWLLVRSAIRLPDGI
ncbi:uncharacterized mitochondrial protein-like protein [Tanacetum coccineum]